MQFEPHGDYLLWTKGNVLYAKLIDAWNKEAAIKFSIEFKELAKTFSGDWGHFVDLTEWDLCNAEVFGIVKDLVDWCIANGLTRAAQVYPPSIIKAQFVDQMVVEEFGGFKRAVFGSNENACDWLTAQGFAAEI